MADRQHLYLLKQNLHIWNEWRKNNPEIEIDLIEADLSEIDLTGADLSNVDLSGAKLISADLSRVNLSGAYLAAANLSFAKLNRANFSFTYLGSCDLSFATLDRANLSGAYLAAANLSFADLSNANLSFANLTKADFSESDAKFSQFSFADSSGVNFYKANLSNTDFKQANLTDANLTEANLTNANLTEANLTNANLSYAIAYFTNFKTATFNGATVESWKINSYTRFERVICDRVYLQSSRAEQNLSDEVLKIDFAPGEFTRLFQKTRESIELVFAEGIDWRCFLSVFKTLLLEWSSSELSIKAIESEFSGAFAIAVEGHFTTEKEKIIESFWLNYNTLLADRVTKDLNFDPKQVNGDRLLQIIEIIADRFEEIESTE